MITRIGKWIAYNYAVGKTDISGEDWGTIFAQSMGGKHLASPVGLVDVVLEGQSWSVKSVKNPKPHICKEVRIISGRNSPDYSYGIQNPHDDPQKTGEAVLSIWNERVNIARDNFSSLRTVTLIREPDSLSFTLFETEIVRFSANEYAWRVNGNGNLEGYEKTSDTHKFTWQPHGAQFTIKYAVPRSAVRFCVKHPPALDVEKTLQQIGFDDAWVTIT